MDIVYFLMVMISDIIGSFSGMGGSIIIKPLFSMMSNYSLEIVIFCSNLSVLTMCLSSLYMSYREKDLALNKTSVSLTIGSFLGGIIGSLALDFLFATVKSVVKPMQITLIILAIILAIDYQLRGQPIKNIWTSIGQYFGLGFICGSVSVILGIGGGPINVWLLMLLAGISLKKATAYSLLAVFASIVTREIMSIPAAIHLHVPIHILIIFFIAAIFGGIGGILAKKYLKTSHYKVIYICTLIGAMIINFTNYFL